MDDSQLNSLHARFDSVETGYQDLRGRMDFMDACLREILRRLPGEGYWRRSSNPPLDQLVPPPFPEAPIPATVYHPPDTTTPRASIPGPDDVLAWAKANPEAARQMALDFTALAVGSKPGN